jgi:hypothetical protein
VRGNDERERRAADIFTTGIRFLRWRLDQVAAWKRGLFEGLEEDWRRWCVEKEGLAEGPAARCPPPGRRPIPPEA